MPWELWDIIQEISSELIQPNPPSSGMLGIAIMMSLCDQVDIYEFLPSKRKTDVCYYYQRYFDSACTMGACHPLPFETQGTSRAQGSGLQDPRWPAVSLSWCLPSRRSPPLGTLGIIGRSPTPTPPKMPLPKPAAGAGVRG